MSISALYYFKIKRASRDIEIPLCLKATLETFVGGAVIPEPTARSAVLARVLISSGYLHPGERNALAKSKVHQISWAHGSPFMGGHPH